MSYTELQWIAKVADGGWRCHYCHSPLRALAKTSLHQLTKDHCIPTAMGGVDELWNILPACLRCNRMKRMKTGAQFIYERAGICEPLLREASFIHALFLQNLGERKRALEEISRFVENVTLKKVMDRPTEYWRERRRLLGRQAEELRQA